MASQSASALRRAIQQFLSENGNSPVADDLRRVERSLGNSGPAPDSPGRRVAREAAGGSADAENPRENRQEGGREEPGDAKPNTPGHDMNNAKPPGKEGGAPPFQGIRKRSTAKELARLRFKSGRSGGGR